jgi:hypothetical protein
VQRDSIGFSLNISVSMHGVIRISLCSLCPLW